MARPHRKGWRSTLARAGGLVCGLLVLGAGVFAQDTNPQPHTIQRTFVTPGDAKPIALTADAIATWVENGQRIVLCRGRARVEQGLSSVSFHEGVVWIDEAQKQNSGIYGLQLYAEGPLTVSDGKARQTAAKGHFALATRGEIRIKAYGSPVVQRALPDEALYRRAVNEVSPNRPAVPAPVPPQPASPQPAPPQPTPPESSWQPDVPAGPPSPGGLEPVAYQEATPGAGVAPSLPPDPPPSPYILTQGPGGLPDGAPVSPGAGPLPPPPRNNPPPQPAAELTPPPPGTKGPARRMSIRPRSSMDWQLRSFPNPATGEHAVVITSGVILTISSATDKIGLLDIEADRLVFWTRGDPNQLLNALRGSQGETSDTLEFFLSGNVEIRNQTQNETQILRADEVYYDVSRNVAVAIRADLEVRQPRLPNPLHLAGDELLMLNPKLYQAKQAEVFSTILPSDPGLKIVVNEATLEDRDIPRKNIFGQTIVNPQTGQPAGDTQRFFTGRNVLLYLEGVPILWLPYIQGDPDDPLGPLEALGFNYNRIFGFQIFTTWSVYDLLGVTPLPGTRWRVNADIMTKRGPALGTDFEYAGRDLFGLPGHYEGLFKAYGIYDTGDDVLGGDRGRQVFFAPGVSVPIDHPDWRGRLFYRGQGYDIPGGFSIQAQLSLLSDRNFLEQFYKPEFDNELNQETFAYLKQQQQNRAWTLLIEPNVRDWVTETEWLPRADFYLLGQKVLDRFTWNIHPSAGYARLRPTQEPPFAYHPTDVRADTGRFDIWSDIGLPLSLGDLKLVPYLVGDAAYYTEDVTGNDRGRLYGGGGLRAALPLSRLYPSVDSDLFNLSGIYHKIVLSGNWFVAHSDTSLFMLPQLDRLNDDATDQALRDIRPLQPQYNPANAAFLMGSPVVNPQLYALRRLVDTRVDTLDSIDVLQLGLRQRWQTKRGFPGHQHIIDWMTLDLHASIFPHSGRDNFGEHLGILEYDWVWNIGDRTSLVSNGWFETTDDGPRFFTFGANLNRPDRTNFYLGYRHYDPLQSRAVVASLTYAFSAKYALTASTMYDLGITDNNVNSLMVTRIGTDLQISFGIHYNAILNNFGVVFEVLPNLLPAGSRIPGGGMGTFARR